MPIRPSLVILLITVACSRTGESTKNVSAKDAPHGVGSVEGDVYLTMQSGDVKRGAGRTVYLVPATDSLAARAGQLCEQHTARVVRRTAAIVGTKKSLDSMWALSFDGMSPKAIHAWDVELDRLKRRAITFGPEQVADDAALVATMDSLFAAAALAQAGTGVNAHYRFPAVPPGHYLLFATLPIVGKHFAWGVQFDLAAGQSMTRDLDGAAESGQQIYCGVR